MKKIFEIATAVFFCFVAIERAFAGEFFTAILCVMIIVNLAADQQTEEVLKMYKKGIKSLNDYNRHLKDLNRSAHAKTKNLSEQIRGAWVENLNC